MLKPSLCNPFVIASCHLTGNQRALNSLEKMLKRWDNFNGFDAFPGAIILKSVSETGGDGKSGKRQMWWDLEYKFLRFSDGPKSKELLLPDVAASLMSSAKKLFPSKVKIGASILIGENSTQSNIRKLIDAGADFIEINTKYLSRLYKDESHFAEHKASRSFETFFDDICKAESVCKIPLWVKFARDINWLKNKEIIDFSNKIRRKDISFVIANTQQVYVADDWRTSNGKAVIWGKTLYPITFDTVKHLIKELNPQIPIIANGGVTTYNQTDTLLKEGASAIEYCAYFHDGKRDFSSWKAKLAPRYPDIS